MQMAIISIESANVSAIHDEAMTVAKELKTQYQRLFEILLVVETRQIYLQLEVPSLFIYCTELLGLSRACATDFIAVVRKSLEVPELADAIREGKTTISKARKICAVLTSENHKDWIDLATECSARIVERAVAMTKPREAVAESMKFVAGDILDFRMAVSLEWTGLLARTKDLLSQRERRNVSSEEATFILMGDFCRKNDPLEKARRAERRKSRKAVPVAQSEIESTQTRYRPASVEHLVTLRDEDRCVFVDSNGKRCESRRWLEKHHIVEFANGGEHTLENLETLCSGHHNVRHLKGGSLVVT